jgi:tetratricopeptide (TPR) repeat protein
MKSQHRAIHLALILIAIVVILLPGCRSMSGKRRDQPLVSARRLSLKGAEALDRARYDDAEMLFAEALESCPSDERAHWGFAETLWKRNDQDEAIQHMNEAVRLSGGNPDYLVRLGEMYLSVGDSLNARVQAQATINQNHQNPQAWALMGNSHRHDKNWSAALEAYHRALLSKPDFPEVQLSIAEVYRQAGNSQRALATLDRVVDLHPAQQTNPELLLVRGLALADLQRKDEAIAILNRASESLEVTKPDKHIQLATTQYRLGELVQARLTVGRILQADPENEEAQNLRQNLDSSFDQLSQPAKTDNAVFR